MSHTLDIMVPHLGFLCVLIANLILNLETHQIVKEKKCAYVFGDGVAWEIVAKNIVQSWNAKKNRQIYKKQMFVCLLNYFNKWFEGFRV